MLKRTPALWKKIDVKFHWSHIPNTVTRYFVNTLPSCVTSIRLHYSSPSLDCTEQLNFAELCVQLQGRCPCLEALILEHVQLSDNLPTVINLCTQFVPGVKILVVRHSKFSYCPTKEEFSGISKIEVLDVSYSYVKMVHELQFSKMPQLRVLNLRRTHFIPRILQSLQNHGLNLEELYLCSTLVKEDNLMFTNSMFPCLKIICLYCRCSISKATVSIIESCQSLQKVYVHEYLVKRMLRTYPLFRHNRCKYNIVEGVAKEHSHNVNYSCKTNKN